MAAINLAPGTEYLALARKRKRHLYVVTGALAIVLLGIWGGLFMFRQQVKGQEQEVDRRIAAIEAEITRLGEEADRIRLFEARLTELDILLDNHTTWDPLLRELERLLPPPIVLTGADVNAENGTIHVDGQTTDIDIVAQTLASLQSTPIRETIFSSANVSNIQRESSENTETGEVSVSYKFVAEMSFNPAALKLNAQ